MLKKNLKDERLIVVAAVSFLELKVLNFNQRMAPLSTLRSQEGI